MTVAALDHELHGHVPEDLYASWSPSLSPDASQVAFVSDRDGLPSVWLRALRGGPLVPVPLGGRRVTEVSWSPTGAWLACLVAPPGRSRHEVWVVRPDGTGARLAAGAAPATAVLSHGCAHGWTADGDLVVTETVRTSQVLRVRPGTGERQVLHEGALVTAVDVSADGGRVLLRSGPRGVRELLLLDTATGALRTVVPLTGAGSSEAGCLSPDGSATWCRTDALAEHAELVGQPGELVVSRPDAELEDVALSGDGRTAVLTWNVDGGLSAVSLLDVGTGVLREVAPLPRPVVHGCTLSRDGSVLALTAEGPADPQGVWYEDLGSGAGPGAGLVALSSPGRGTLQASQGATVPGIEPVEVVAPRLERWRAPDGTALSGWLYTPAGPGPHRTLVWLHGGPEAQERPVYDSLFQSLVAEDVAVLAPNVRGSTGFGRTFRDADNGPGRYAAFTDVAACVAHLVEAGIAPAGRIGVSGRSYGGYLTLAALTRYPELFQVGVDVCGMSDLHTFYAGTEPWIGAAAVTKYGDPVRDADLLRDLSPLHALDRLRAPLLLVHGADDTNVPVGEARQVAAALAARGAPHQLLVFEGEGHELLGSQARVAFVQATVHWVLEHL